MRHFCGLENEFEVAPTVTHRAWGQGGFQPAGHEHRHAVARPKRRQLAHFLKHLRGHRVEVNFEVVADAWRRDAAVDLGRDALLDGCGEVLELVAAQLQACRHGVPAKLLEVGTAIFKGVVDVHAAHASRTAHQQAILFAQHDGGAVTRLDQAARHDAQHAAVPPFATHDGAAAPGRLFGHLGQGFFGHVLVQVPPSLIHGFELVSQFIRRVVVGSHEQLHGFERVANPSCGVDARTQREADVSNRVGDAVDVGDVQHGADARPHRLAQFAHAVVGQNPVLTGDFHQICANAQRQQIQVVVNRRHGQTNGVDQPGEQFEGHPGARQFLEGVGAVLALGVQQGVRDGQGVCRQVVVAHDGVDAGLCRRCEGVKIFGPTIQRDDEGASGDFGALHTFGRHSVSLAVPHRDVGEHGHLQTLQKRRHHGHRGGPIHVVVAVDHDALVALDGFHDARHGFVHVLHQEGVVQLFPVRVQKILHLLGRDHAPLNQQGCNQRIQTRVF